MHYEIIHVVLSLAHLYGAEELAGLEKETSDCEEFGMSACKSITSESSTSFMLPSTGETSEHSCSVFHHWLGALSSARQIRTQEVVRV